MKFSYKSTKRAKSILSVILGLCVVLSFQNCSDLDNSSVVTLTDVERSVFENLPFAYDLKIDQLSYMSCSGPSANQDSRSFTLKAGGFFPGSGVGLRSSFAATMQNYNADAKVRSLAVSARNDQAGVVMSLRPRTDLQNYLLPREAPVESVLDKMMFREEVGLVLSNERVAKQLFALGPDSYLNYVAGVPGLFNKAFEGKITIANESGTENSIRNFLRNSYYLAFNFAEPVGVQSEERPYNFVRSPYDTLSGDSRARSSVFGLGYVLNFQQSEPAMTTSPQRAMTVSNAVNLENSSVVAESWNCNERFVIVRPDDAARATFNPTMASPGGTQQVCDTRPDAIPTSLAEERRWERIRNILPVEDWYVNLPCPGGSGPQPAGCSPGIPKPGCIIPKGDDFCYNPAELFPSNDANIRVAYYRNEGLNMNNPAITYNGNCGPGTNFMCPHIVTICYKTN